MRIYPLMFSAYIPFSLFAASQTFIPQGPAPVYGPIVTTPPNLSVNQNGATQAVAINPSNSQNLYIGTTSGGIWSTNNFGSTWTSLLGQVSNLSISSLVFDPTDASNKTLVAGTGITTSGSVVLGPNGVYGGPSPSGLYYTTDGGSTWSSLGAATLATQTVSSIIARGSTILAATYEPVLLQPASGYGLFVSTNTGSTFALAPTGGAGQLKAGPVSCLVSDPQNNSTIYAALYGNVDFQNTALYKSSDTGSMWTSVFGEAQSGGFINNTNLTSIKAATGVSGSVAVLVIQGFPADMRVFLSSNSGGSWTELDTSSISQDMFNVSPELSSIAIDANDPSVVYISGTTTSAEVSGGFPGTVYRLHYTGGVTNVTPLYLGADGSATHADTRMSISLSNGGLIVSSDGGIALRTNANSSGGVWQSLVGQNLMTVETYDSAYDGNNNVIMTSSQDNGTCIQNSTSNPIFTQIYPGDGLQVLVNDQSSSSQSVYYFTSNGDAYPFRLTNTSGTQSSFNFIYFVPSLQTPVTPIALNRNTSTWLAVASQDPVSGYDVSIAQDLGSQGLNQTLAGTCTQGPSAMAYGTQDALHALAVCAPGAGLYYTSNASTVSSLALLTAYATASGNNSPTAVVFDPRSSQRFFVTDSTHVYETTNAGTSFSSALSVPANITLVKALEFISSNGVNAFVVGGYSSTASSSSIAVADCDSGGTLTSWRLFGLGLPDVFVMNLDYNSKSDVLLVGLWGRGAWTMYDVTSNFSTATQLQFGLANNNSTPDSSILTGSRPLVKYGTGTLTITGTATYTGPSTVNAGTMIVSGIIPGDVQVNSGATLKGTGQVGGTVTVASGGLLAPGNPSSSMMLGGLVLNSGSSTAFQLLPSTLNSSEAIVTGPVSLDGTLYLTQNSGYYAAPLTYTLILGEGGITGQYSSVATISPYGGFKFTLLSFPTLLQLRLEASLPPTLFSGNDRKFAKYLNNNAIGSEALNLLAHLTTNELPSGVNAASPTRTSASNYTASKTALTIGSGLATRREDMLFHQFAQPTLAKYEFPQEVRMSELQSRTLLASSGDSLPAGSVIEGVRKQEKNGLWIDGFADFAHQDSQKQTPALDSTTLGFLLGYDRYMEKGWIGVAAGYANTWFSEHHSLGDGDIDSVFLVPYGTVTFYDAYFEAGLMGAYNHTEQKRKIHFTGFSETAKGSFVSWQLMPHVGFGYDFSWDFFVLEPFVSFDFLTTWQEGFKEHGSPVYDMKYKSQTSYFLQSELGLRLYQRWEKKWGAAVLQETLGYINQAPFGTGRVRAGLVGNGSFFTVESFTEHQNLFNYGLSGIIKAVNGYFVNLSIEGEVGSRYMSFEPQIKMGRLF